MNRIAMVSIEKLLEVARDNSKPIGENLDFFTSYYESGMVEVLREVAFRKLIEIEHTLYNDAKEYNTANKKAVDSYKKLFEQLNTEYQKSSLLDLEAAYNSVAAYDCESHFIRGFIEGYKFIKMTSH